MKKIKLMIIGLAVVFLAASAAYAQTESKYQERGDWQKGRIFKELNLTQDQQKKLEGNRAAQRGEMTNLRAAMKEKQAKLREELKNPSVTKASVEPLVSELKSLQGQSLDHRINGIFEVKEILTPEQFAKFQQMTEKRQENKKGRFQNWRDKKNN
jgi:Spy/CpxP family protein refolding chaperone